MKKFLTLLLALAMMLTLVACGGNSEPAAEGGEDAAAGVKEELVIGTDENVTTLDPQGSNSRPNEQLYYLTHNNLVKDDGAGNIVPDLAESYEKTGDLEWTFHLRQGVKFHNGEELKAGDVAFTLTRALDSSFTADYVEHIEKTEAVGDYDVVITLKDDCQDILFFLRNKTLSILNEKAVTEDPDNGPIVGTGPFVLREWELNDHTTVDRFEDYFGELPQTKTITFRIIPEAAARIISLQTGEIDVCEYPAAIDLPTVTGNPDLQLLQVAGDTMNYVTFNTTRAPFDNADVRHAVAYAIDRAKVIEVAEEGNASPAYTFFSPGYAMTEDVEHYDYDPAKATELLASAGYTEANPLKITMVCSGDTKLLQAQVIQQCLKEVGVEMAIESLELTALKDLFKAADYDISLYNWANESLGPDTNCRPILGSGSGSNRSHFADAHFDELIDKGLVEADDAARQAIYAEAQQYAIEQLPIMPLYYQNVYVPATANLKGFTPNASECHDFSMAYVVE